MRLSDSPKKRTEDKLDRPRLHEPAAMRPPLPVLPRRRGRTARALFKALAVKKTLAPRLKPEPTSGMIGDNI
jgi:hypothetical protein